MWRRVSDDGLVDFRDSLYRLFDVSSSSSVAKGNSPAMNVVKER
jgi:hypothetical protein